MYARSHAGRGIRAEEKRFGFCQTQICGTGEPAAA
jgi:hypothetical protein